MTSSRAAERVTIIDVAKEANVSFATVSRVVNGKGYVSPQTRDRVMTAMTRTGYVVNRQARGLAGGRYQVVGLLVPDLDTSYIGEILRGIDEELAANSYDLMLYTTHRRKTRESIFVGSLTQGMTDGLLMILPTDPGSYIESIKRRAFPYVMIDHGGMDDKGPSVGATNFQGAFDATCYLIELGHRRIGFITGNQEMGCAVDRLAGYRHALARAGIEHDPTIVKEGDFHEPLAYQRAIELVTMEGRPTAIFASNDLTAFGVIDAARDAGLKVPEDLSVIGFDDIPGASYSNPPLTTVRQPLLEMGRLATRMLFERIADPKLDVRRIEMPTELKIRATCRSIHGQ